MELARYIEWFLNSPQAEAEVENQQVVPVTSTVANRIRSDVLERMTCDGQLLMDLVRHQKYVEDESLKTWKLPVQIVTPLIAVIILILVVYAIVQRVQYLRTLNRDYWKVNFYDIDFFVPRKRHRAVNSSVETDKDARSALSESRMGRWNIHEVVLSPLSIASVFNVNWKLKKVLMRMREEIGHENISRFIGISTHNNAVYLVEQYCANGTLAEFLRDNKYSVKESFRYVVCADIARGMAYLHRHNLIHGNLSIDKCHVDSRWTIKIVEWEYTALYEVLRRTSWKQPQDTRQKSVLHYLLEGSPVFRHLAPEIQKDGCLFEPTRAGDVYSFGIIMHDLFVNSTDQELHTSSVFVDDEMPAKASQIMKLACSKTAINRPTFEQLERSIRSAINGGQTNLVDRCVNPPGLAVICRPCVC